MRNKEILEKPLPADPIEASRGFLKGGKSLAEALLKDRRAERTKEKKLLR